MRLENFQWPLVGERRETPVWNGRHFIVASKQCEFLACAESDSAWSPELTALHEKEANFLHPIDIASRKIAVQSMRQLATRESPIILDVGCSAGSLIEDLLREIPQAAIIGGDYLLTLVLRAARRIKNVPFLQFDLRNCPLADNCLDGVTALNVLEHIDDDVRALKEIQRILKRGGVAHIEVPADPSSFDFYDEVLLHFRRYRLQELVAKAWKAGFAVLKATHLGFFAYPIFKFIKRQNQKAGRGLTYDEKKQLVARAIGRTARARILTAAFDLEQTLGSVFTYPIGIRAVLRLQKE
jgi:ubiquinone/menaquinone biosynthesis C-methylase UbiE